MRRAAVEGLAGVGVLALACAVAAPLLTRAAAAVWVGLFPGSVQIAVLTGDARVPAGQPLQIRATISGRGAELLGVVPSVVVSADGEEHRAPMTRSAEGFVYPIDAVDRSFEYQVLAGAAASRAYAVTALFPPRVTRIDVRYEYPSFTRMPPRAEEDAGDVYGPAGTKVRLVIHTDKPVAGGELALAEGRPVALGGLGSTRPTADLVLARDDAYRVKLEDREGMKAVGDVEYFIRLMDDRPPGIRIVRPAADQGITPLQEVAIEARADDDHGVASMELVYTVAGRPPRTVRFARTTGTEVDRIGSYMLHAEDLGVQPGDVITYYARARDVARGKRSTETRSDIYFLEVKPFNEEFVSAQSQAGGGGAGTPIDGLIAAQKEIINATWNLERRSVAGRSADDLKAVGDAQAELKGRVEDMLSGRRSRGRGVFPQQVAPRPQRPPRALGQGDPIGAAVDSMGKAVEQLQSERTADAIPHEMAALQGLLQAQAEIRRREVMQQSASAAGQGGTSRTDRDLSALFDRELQRQQRTNYENPQETGSSEDRSTPSDAVDRVRDLARRQEELSERLRALAGGGLSEEELKRQLARLTREQEELRREAEALEQRMQQSAGTEGRQGGRGAQGASRATGRMREAAQEMQKAARDLERQNAAGAAATAERAARGLREIERQVGGTTNARQRAAGELQLEAQQVAEGQRQIAREMARLEKGSGQAGGDALRRLAGEKEKLADRIDELHRRAGELQRDLPGEAGATVRAAARQLEREKIGERMRRSAEEVRRRASQGGDPQTGSEPRQGDSERTEQQLSSALDAVVQALGGETQGEARRLTQELDRTRDMRERLNRLERQVRAAEAQAKAAQGGETANGAGRSGSNAPAELQRAREEYARELQRASKELGRTQAGRSGGAGGATPEHHEYSRSAPGTEAFKQDFAGWEALRKSVDDALDEYEASLTGQAVRKMPDDRLSAGGSDRVPDAYRDPVARYFQSIAKGKK
jgi:hypothetical protein